MTIKNDDDEKENEIDEEKEDDENKVNENVDSTKPEKKEKKSMKRTGSAVIFTVQEDRNIGKVTFKTYLTYLKSCGYINGFIVIFLCLVIILYNLFLKNRLHKLH